MIIHQDYPLQSLNTFGVQQYAKQFGIVQSLENIHQALVLDPNPFIIGGGSNILLTKNPDGLVLKNELKGKSILTEMDETIIVRLMSGENWHECVQWAVSHGWGGIENLSLIPGTVGAAPMQNIGAYGAEIKDVLIEVAAMDLQEEKEVIFSNRGCKFGYRDSIFKNPEYRGKYFITSIVLELSKHPVANAKYADIEKKLTEKNITHPTIEDIHHAVIEVRQYKLPDPAIIGNAGSFFKNPIISIEQFEKLKSIKHDAIHYPVDATHVKVPAGWLIDQAGWKGKTIGRVGCFERQALVIVNRGSATGEEIWKFAELVKNDVFEKFDIHIEPEINIW
ncbi:MAG: UDP-N-acetylmuramate dehydrogenase [Saprospiraceae bacterium]